MQHTNAAAVSAVAAAVGGGVGVGGGSLLCLVVVRTSVGVFLWKMLKVVVGKEGRSCRLQRRRPLNQSPRQGNRASVPHFLVTHQRQGRAAERDLRQLDVVDATIAVAAAAAAAAVAVAVANKLHDREKGSKGGSVLLLLLLLLLGGGADVSCVPVTSSSVRRCRRCGVCS